MASQPLGLNQDFRLRLQHTTSQSSTSAKSIINHHELASKRLPPSFPGHYYPFDPLSQHLRPSHRPPRAPVTPVTTSHIGPDHTLKPR